ncbi:hypothetical protein MUP95_09530, partial [bacterium]|nr:hypothetical protein [bacterium]
MRKQKRPINKSRIRERFRVCGLIFLTLSLTLLSLKAQFHFWEGLFGTETAVVSSLVFEILRLSALWIMLKWIGMKKIIGTIFYIAIAVFCGSVAVT